MAFASVRHDAFRAIHFHTHEVPACVGAHCADMHTDPHRKMLQIDVRILGLAYRNDGAECSGNVCKGRQCAVPGSLYKLGIVLAQILIPELSEQTEAASVILVVTSPGRSLLTGVTSE